MTVRNSRLTVVSAWCAAVALGMMFAARVGWAACQDFDPQFDPQCMANGVCQADGTCQGTPIHEGQACNDNNPVTGPCTITATCQNGKCASTQSQDDTTPCTSSVFGSCATGAKCQNFNPPVPIPGFPYLPAVCLPTAHVSCPTCQFCDPSNGQCVPMPCGQDPCSNGQCDMGTGFCAPGHEGAACDDGKVCTTGTICQAGVCQGGAAAAPTATPTKPGASQTPTTIAQRTATPTPTQPLAAQTPTTTPSVSACVGDCNHAGQVTVDEILTMIKIALGNAPVGGCLAGDGNSDGRITIDEILAAVNNALNGCPQQTSPGPGSAVSGQTTVALSAVTVIGDVVAALANGYTLGGAASAASSTELLMTPADPGLGQAAGSCPLGGSATRTGSLFSSITVTFQDNCAVATADGKVTFGGTASFGLSGISAAVTTIFSNLSGSTVFQETAANVVGSIVGLPTQGGSCFITAISFRLSGTLDSTMMPPGGPHVGVEFTNTTLDVSNITFNASCVPTAYDLTLTGPATLLAPDGSSVDVIFSGLKIHVNSSGNPTTLKVTGGMSSPCFSGTGTVTATLDTPTLLTVPSHESCPNGGIITATLPQGTTTISFGPGGSVHVQGPTENLTAPNCFDPRLLMCVA